jgi:hypothetical protein
MNSHQTTGSRECRVSLLHELLTYCPETGVLLWKQRDISHFKAERDWRAWNNKHVGKVAGSINDQGYLVVMVKRESYRAHRIVVAMQTGAWPSGEVDHIDGNPRNNRWGNLRIVSGVENRKNQKRPVTNQSGALGVDWHKRAGKWRAQIGIAGTSYHLGLFNKFEDALAARKAAEAKYGFHENHGRAA